MKYELYQDHINQYRWRLKAANGRIIADSGEGYTTKANCLHGISLVKAAPVEDLTVKTTTTSRW